MPFITLQQNNGSCIPERQILTGDVTMDKNTKRKVNEELDMIAKLQARADQARIMCLTEIARGCFEDIERRRQLIASILRT
tara:strand:- start:1255 stop:1497 length:243 start_codon:yes stop_codon:yes gene_type:complete